MQKALSVKRGYFVIAELAKAVSPGTHIHHNSFLSLRQPVVPASHTVFTNQLSSNDWN
jgi:hypothetical protein